MARPKMGVHDRTAPSVGGSRPCWPTFSLVHRFILICECWLGEEFQGRSEIAFEIWVALIIYVLFFFFSVKIKAFLLSRTHGG